jgi:lysophospholipase L1-like esterase
MKSSPPFAILKIIAVNLMVAAVFITFIEGTTRIVSMISGKGFRLLAHELDPHDKGVEGNYIYHPFAGFVFRPNHHFTAGHPNQDFTSQLFTDRNGFLTSGNQIPLKKKPDEIRIATIGASTTASLNLNYEENWPGILGKMVQNAVPNTPVTIINAGVPGFDTAQSIPNLALRVLPFHPDIVVIYHAYNDLKAVRKGLRFKPDYSHIHPTPFGMQHKPSWIVRFANHSMFYVRTRNLYRAYLNKKKVMDRIRASHAGNARYLAVPEMAADAFVSHMRSLVSISRSAGSRVVLTSFATLHDPSLAYDSADVPDDMSDLARIELGMLLYFTPGLTLEGILTGIRRYNTEMEKIAAELQTGWVDNAALLPHDEVYFVDRVHFSRKGALKMAENLYPTVLQSVREVLRKRLSTRLEAVRDE